jgi:hypothetical protein
VLRIQHLLLVELLQELMESARPELIAGKFQPFLGHCQQGGARIVISRVLCQFKALGCGPPELLVLITLHSWITAFAGNLFPPVGRKVKF